MALSKSITHSNGAVSTYWRITSVTVNKRDKKASVKISGFLTAQTASGNASKEFNVSGDDFDTYFPVIATANIYAEAYVYLKTQAYFSNSSDV